MTSLRDRMQADLTIAMKARDTTRVAVLRSSLGALANAEAVDSPTPSSTPVPFGTSEVDRRELDGAAVHAVLQAEVDELRSTSAELRGRGRGSDADDLDARAAILLEYLR